ncbi:hypothetical protein OG729_36465 [Streptomyces sp. NBC_00210]
MYCGWSRAAPGEDAAALGAGILAIEHALSPAQVDRQPARAAVS